MSSPGSASAKILALRWPYSPLALDIGWAVFSALNLVAIFWFANWETIPFHFIWISLTVLYGFQPWRGAPTMWVLGAVMLTTVAGIGLDVWRGSEPPAELTEVPLMAALFWIMLWHKRDRCDPETAELDGQRTAKSRPYRTT